MKKKQFLIILYLLSIHPLFSLELDNPEIDEFINSAKATMLQNINSEELSDNQEQMVADLCESIVCSESKESWAETMESCVKDFKEIENLQTLTEVLSISSEHNLELYPAAILHHSKENS